MKKNFKILFVTALMLMNINFVFSQAKKPTIMVVPSDVWCTKNGYMSEYDNQGTKVSVPNYQAAVQENSDLLLVISKINELMAERGFPLKNLPLRSAQMGMKKVFDAQDARPFAKQMYVNPLPKIKKP